MIINMDNRTGMGMFPDNHFDAIVCDPPYELGFMGKAWDASGIANSVEMWREALRVLKPGGHLLAFSGARTYHRMTCAIEDAGFEVRDQIMWVYGSGFPKSMDVSKAIDKAAGVVREVVGTRKSEGGRTSQANTEGIDPKALIDITAPATDAARQWEGWGTALKPAHEPICVARKPLIGTVAANVLAHGVGGLNIDGCRVEFQGDADKASAKPGGKTTSKNTSSGSGAAAPDAGREAARVEFEAVQGAGRWPANLIHDGSDEVTGLFGEPARFFYCAKASKSDRGPGNDHPTVKPTEVMRYLVRLVTPPGGIVLDHFAGSGSTGVACKLEGFNFVGFELSAEYAEIGNRRIENVNAK